MFIEPDYGNVLPLTSEDFTCGNSQHPIDDVTAGERLIKDTYEAIRNSKLWETSMLIVTWDEHGGFYDHVRPGPAVPPGDGVSTSGNVRHGFGFDQLGVRVPAVVVSPLVPRNTIDHTVYDHSSIPATLERNFGLEPLTARDAAANDVVHLLSLTTPRTTEAEAPTRLPEPATSAFRCVGVFDLIADTHAEEIAEVKGAAEAPAEPGPEKVDHRAEITRRRRAKEPLRSKEEGERARREQVRDAKAAIPPDVRAVEMVAVLREISMLRRWDVRGRLEVLERYVRRSDEEEVRNYIARVRGKLRAREGTSTTVSRELEPEEGGTA